jgi:hypothetical protein
MDVYIHHEPAYRNHEPIVARALRKISDVIAPRSRDNSETGLPYQRDVAWKNSPKTNGTSDGMELSHKTTIPVFTTIRE